MCGNYILYYTAWKQNNDFPSYQSDPMASVYLSKPVKGLQKMIGEKYFKDNYNKPNQHYKVRTVHANFIHV